ncbi:hypothetical protein Hsero_0922 [Herbaspirillum seropedicae SmR1]|uniref:Uncharacterized protein n=1 Tax=Herbaspirillum seropedicae (strain SmR1) TaxID=757424 RepID=D8J0A2_HERSS|nr:hypothetical protein Hsero_0922 [Herbaspirillum seropedicae SmR1]
MLFTMTIQHVHTYLTPANKNHLAFADCDALLSAEKKGTPISRNPPLDSGSPPRESNTAPTDYESKAHVDGTPQRPIRRGPLVTHTVRQFAVLRSFGQNIPQQASWELSLEILGRICYSETACETSLAACPVD